MEHEIDRQGLYVGIRGFLKRIYRMYAFISRPRAVCNDTTVSCYIDLTSRLFSSAMTSLNSVSRLISPLQNLLD